MLGHWASEHGQDGSLPPEVKSTADPQPCEAKIDAAAKKTNSGASKNVLNFNMARVARKQDETDLHARVNTDDCHGALLDDGAPYTMIGKYELQVVPQSLLPDWKGESEPLSKHLARCSHWQYGSGEHSSTENVILRSNVKTVASAGGTLILILYVVLDGSSERVVGRNLTKYADILHSKPDCVRVTGPKANEEVSTLSDINLHSYIPMSAFLRGQNVNNEISPDSVSL